MKAISIIVTSQKYFCLLFCIVASLFMCPQGIGASNANIRHPLLGEVAPLVTLQLRTADGDVEWHSKDQLGKQRLLYLLLPTGYDESQLNEFLPKLPSNAQKYLVFHNPLRKNWIAPLLWQVLQDNKQILSSCYAPKKSQPTAIIIDSSGFIRLIEPIKAVEDWKKVFVELNRTTTSIQVGKEAPDFIIRDMNGVARSLHQLRGKRHLLLTFFPKCFTFTCGMQLSSLRDSWRNLESKNLEVWGVSVDEAKGARGQKAFAEYLHLPFPLLPDSGHQLCLLYGSVVSPNQMSSRMSVLIDKNGIVRWIDKQIDPRHYGDDVLRKMNELGMN